MSGVNIKSLLHAKKDEGKSKKTIRKQLKDHYTGTLKLKLGHQKNKEKERNNFPSVLTFFKESTTSGP